MDIWFWVIGAIVVLLMVLFAHLLTRYVRERARKGAPQRETPTATCESAGGTLARMKTSAGVMVLRLHEKQVPNTVANFMHLASKGFYDGLVFHRVIAEFMVQGGCPKGDGKGSPGWLTADEFVDELKHDSSGCVSMANAGPDTNGSQFFITLAPTPWLDGKHTIFGRVVEGLDVLQKIGALETDDNDRPLAPVTIEGISLFRNGRHLTGEQPMPETCRDSH